MSCHCPVCVRLLCSIKDYLLTYYELCFQCILWPHHANTSRHTALAADTTAHHLQNRAHGFRLLSWPMSEVLQRRVHSCAHCGRTFASKISRPRWPRHPARAVSFRLPQFSCFWIDNLEWSSCKLSKHWQFKRSLKSWLFECAYGRRRVWETVQFEAHLRNGLTYLLILLCTSCP